MRSDLAQGFLFFWSVDIPAGVENLRRSQEVREREKRYFIKQCSSCYRSVNLVHLARICCCKHSSFILIHACNIILCDTVGAVALYISWRAKLGCSLCLLRCASAAFGRAVSSWGCTLLVIVLLGHLACRAQYCAIYNLLRLLASKVISVGKSWLYSGYDVRIHNG